MPHVWVFGLAACVEGGGPVSALRGLCGQRQRNVSSPCLRICKDTNTDLLGPHDVCGVLLGSVCQRGYVVRACRGVGKNQLGEERRGTKGERGVKGEKGWMGVGAPRNRMSQYTSRAVAQVCPR